MTALNDPSVVSYLTIRDLFNIVIAIDPEVLFRNIPDSEQFSTWLSKPDGSIVDSLTLTDANVDPWIAHGLLGVCTSRRPWFTSAT